MDGKPSNRNAIIRKALEAQHRAAFVVTRAEKSGDGADTIKIIAATDKPITHFLWSKWDYVDIQLAMTTQAMRSDRFKAGAAFLMDHDTRDQRGVIESFELKNGELHAEVRLSQSQRGQELKTDMLDGIRQQISLGFMIHNLVLVEERKGQPDLYEARDWEPYEASSVAVAADIDAKVMRAMAARRDGMETCPDCNMPIDECTCDPATENSSEASRQKRAISNSNKEENQMTPEEIAAEEAKNRRAARIEVTDEITARAVQLGNPALAAEFHQKRLFDEEKGDPSVEAFMAFARTKIKPSTPIPGESAAAAAARQNGDIEFAADGDVTIDKRTREVLESRGFNLDDKQLAAISTRSYKLAFGDYIRKGIGGMGNDHRRALSEGTDSEGGFLVPGEFLAKMVEREAAATSLQNEVTNLTTGSDKLTLPKNAYSASNLYTTGIRVSWVDEKTGPSSEADASDFGNITFPIHTAMMYHDVTKNMIEDSQFDILGWLQSKFGETADVVKENMVLNGSGIGQPAGILLNPNGTDEPATVVSGDANLIKADGLIDLAWALLGRYKGNARFVFNSTSAGKAIAKLKDGDNRYLFAMGVNDDGLASARPKSLLGYPFIESDFMPDVAANAYPVIFGDLKGYYLVNRVGFSIQILNEIVATANKVRVLGRMRIGGQVAEDWRLKIQKIST